LGRVPFIPQYVLIPCWQRNLLCGIRVPEKVDFPVAGGIDSANIASSAKEVRMTFRLVSLFLLVSAIPAFSQYDNAAQQTKQKIWSQGQMMRTDSPPEIDAQKTRLVAIHQDAASLSDLSASLQSDLAQLQKGILAKDLEQKLKKVEKLAKRLRQEMMP
jgi:hypothetical protein